MERRCKKCGKLFTIHIAQTKNGEGIYCSRSCARSGSPTRKRNTLLVECSTCGKKFDKYRAEARKNKGGKHFCSSDCWYSYNQRDNHYLWSGGQDERMNPEGVKWRNAVLRRDKHHCRICHATRKLEAHHILPFRSHIAERWLVSNGITLCHDCHTQLAHRELEHAEILQFIASVKLEVWHVEYDEKGDTASSPEVL